jgi:hypothetical protein
MAVAVSVATLGTYPPRLQVSVTGLTIGDAVTLYRNVGGDSEPVRGGSTASVTATAFVVNDNEQPFGAPFTYTAVVNTTNYVSASQNVALPGGKVVLSDAITGAAAEVIISAWDEKTYTRPAAMYRAGGRNVVVSSANLGQFTADIELVTDSESSRVALFAVLDDPTEGVLQLRSADSTTYDGVDCYIVVTDAREKRYSQRGDDQRRFWTLTLVEVEGWSDLLTPAGFTLLDLANAYTGLTLAAINSAYATLLAIAQADLS